MRKTIFTTLFTLALALPALAQDTIKVNVSFINSDFSVDNRQGFSGEVDAKVLGKERFRIGGVFQFARHCSDCSPRFDTYSGGPQLSYDVFNKRISLFGRALFGATTNYTGTRAFTRTYGGGADVNFGNFFVRPFALDFLRIEGVPMTVNRYSAGGGVRF